MVKPHDAFRIDQDISTSLAHVFSGLLRETSPCELLQVGPPCARAPDIQKARVQHPVSRIHLTRFIDQERPPELSVLHIAAGQETRLERYHHHAGFQRIELLFVLPQLPQVPPARQSTQMAVEDHQEPSASVVIETVGLPGSIDHFERYGGVSD